LPRHRTIPSNRSKAIALVAAGAFAVTGAAAAATWTHESGQAPAGAAQAAAVIARPAITSHVARTQATRQAARAPQAVSLAVRAFQIKATQDTHAAARWQHAQHQAEQRVEAARAAAASAQSQAAQSQADQSQAAQAEQPQQATTPAAPSVASGSPEQIAQAMLHSFGWSAGQFSCLYPLWEHESGWSVTAANPDGAYGIPQALPGAKMASAGPNWQTNATTQIRWGLEYIKAMYGSPCGAWGHEQATGWY
jgi:hypothetical protein